MKTVQPPEIKLKLNHRLAVATTLISGVGSGLLAASLGLGAAVFFTLSMGIGLTLFYFTQSKVIKSPPPAISSSSETRLPKEEIPLDRLDPLTGLANENGLMAWLSEQQARIAADGKKIIIITADLKDFNSIETKYGKQVSDLVLIEVAYRVATCTGSEGIAARTNGDEFAVIATVVPEKSAELAAEQAGKLAGLIQRPVELPSGIVWIGGSVGAAAGSVDEWQTVLLNARAALKRSKELGRTHYVVHKIFT